MTKPKTMTAAEFRRMVGLPTPQPVPSWAEPLHDATEPQVMAEIEACLRFLGCETPAIARKLKSEPEGWFIRTNQRRGDMAGGDAGCPDILVCPVAAVPVWLPFEVKRRRRGKRGGWLAEEWQPEQRLLRDAGSLWIVNSAADVLLRVKRWRKIIGEVDGAVWATLSQD